jgi:hypothetical protein
MSLDYVLGLGIAAWMLGYLLYEALRNRRDDTSGHPSPHVRRS